MPRLYPCILSFVYVKYKRICEKIFIHSSNVNNFVSEAKGNIAKVLIIELLCSYFYDRILRVGFQFDRICFFATIRIVGKYFTRYIFLFKIKNYRKKKFLKFCFAFQNCNYLSKKNKEDTRYIFKNIL